MVVIDSIRSGAGSLSATIRVGRRRHELFFASGSELSDNAADALVLLALPAAMRCGGPLVIDVPVSGQLLRQVPHIQDIYHEWDPGLKHVDLRAPVRPSSVHVLPAPSRRQAIAFTGGVDSFYSALQQPGCSLLYVHGLDIPLTNHQLRKQVSGKLTCAAAGMERPLLEIETDLRTFSDRYLKWQLAFGAALAACAMLLSRHIDVFGIPAGQALESFQPDGAHPLLNALFSTEYLDVQTVGCKTERVDKVAAIAASPVVQQTLRVCWENRGNTYNCGVCEKCLRTMAALDIFGHLPAFSVFAVPLDDGRLSRAVAREPSLEMFIRENLRAAREHHARPELIRSIEKSLDPRRAWFFRLLNYRVPRLFYDWTYRVTSPKRRVG